MKKTLLALLLVLTLLLSCVLTSCDNNPSTDESVAEQSAEADSSGEPVEESKLAKTKLYKIVEGFVNYLAGAVNITEESVPASAFTHYNVKIGEDAVLAILSTLMPTAEGFESEGEGTEEGEMQISDIIGLIAGETDIVVGSEGQSYSSPLIDAYLNNGELSLDLTKTESFLGLFGIESLNKEKITLSKEFFEINSESVKVLVNAISEIAASYPEVSESLLMVVGLLNALIGEESEESLPEVDLEAVTELLPYVKTFVEDVILAFDESIVVTEETVSDVVYEKYTITIDENTVYAIITAVCDFYSANIDAILPIVNKLAGEDLTDTIGKNSELGSMITPTSLKGMYMMIVGETEFGVITNVNIEKSSHKLTSSDTVLTVSNISEEETEEFKLSVTFSPENGIAIKAEDNGETEFECTARIYSEEKGTDTVSALEVKLNGSEFSVSITYNKNTGAYKLDLSDIMAVITANEVGMYVTGVFKADASSVMFTISGISAEASGQTIELIPDGVGDLYTLTADNKGTVKAIEGAKIDTLKDFITILYPEEAISENGIDAAVADLGFNINDKADMISVIDIMVIPLFSEIFEQAKDQENSVKAGNAMMSALSYASDGRLAGVTDEGGCQTMIVTGGIAYGYIENSLYQIAYPYSEDSLFVLKTASADGSKNQFNTIIVSSQNVYEDDGSYFLTNICDIIGVWDEETNPYGCTEYSGNAEIKYVDEHFYLGYNESNEVNIEVIFNIDFDDDVVMFTTDYSVY